MPHKLMDFEERPLLIFWELTKACKLKCKHCRAEAISEPLEDELKGEEALKLIEDIEEFGDPLPILILTGGDPLMRRDLREIVSYAKRKGIRMGIAPAVTDLIADKIDLIDEIGSVSISLDGIGEKHDLIRGDPGNFYRTLDYLKMLLRRGIKVQVNTLVAEENVSELPKLAKLLMDVGIRVWELFFLIKVGRGIDLNELTPQECEDVCHFLIEVSRYGMEVRTVEAPFFRRVAEIRKGFEEATSRCGPLYTDLTEHLISLLGPPAGSPNVRSSFTRDGNGVIFVSHNGEVYPSGFAPLRLGNVREESLVKIYRENEILKKIRRAEFKGRCGICEYRFICGGSRARAFSRKGDILDEDPCCIYEPEI
jgi:radical SAM protein